MNLHDKCISLLILWQLWWFDAMFHIGKQVHKAEQVLFSDLQWAHSGTQSWKIPKNNENKYGEHTTCFQVATWKSLTLDPTSEDIEFLLSRRIENEDNTG